MNNGITLRDMMCHRTGLPRYDYSWYLFPSKSRDSLLQRIAYQEPSYALREKWQYNNFMFLLQGMIAEKITNNSWEKNISQKIFKPLKMHTANFSVDTMATKATTAKGYYVDNKNTIQPMPYYNIDAMGPAGSINATVQEMGNWVITWINNGKFNGKQVLPSSYVKEAISSQMVMGSGLPSSEVPDVHFNNYGFGWMLASYRGHYRVEHGGNIDGFTASTCFFPTDSIGIVVLCNQNGSRVNAVVRNLIADRLLKLPYKDWTTSTKNNIDSVKKVTDKAKLSIVQNKKLNAKYTHSLNAYDGNYTNKAYGTLAVMAANDSLFAVLPTQKWWLKHNNYNTFEPYEVDAFKGIDTSESSELRIQFTINTMGDIDALTMPLEPSIPTPATFIKSPRVKASMDANALKEYEATFTLSGIGIEVKLKNNKLVMLVPGQPEYELQPIDKDKFALKDVPGYSVQFNRNADKQIIELLSIQPNGTFKAEKKK